MIDCFPARPQRGPRNSDDVGLHPVGGSPADAWSFDIDMTLKDNTRSPVSLCPCAVAASPSLGREWKRGFLHGGTKSSPPPPARPAAVITDTQEVGSGQTSPVVEPGGNSKSSTKSTRPCNAFQELVVEKSVDLGAATVPVSNVRPCEVKPPRVSRFRARRQGLQ